MGMSFLFVIFTGMFVAPLILGSFIIAQDAGKRTLTAWFGLATLIFYGMAALGAFFLVTKPT